MSINFSPRSNSLSTTQAAPAEGDGTRSKHPIMELFGPNKLISTKDSDGPEITYEAKVDPPLGGGNFKWQVVTSLSAPLAIKISGVKNKPTVEVRTIAGKFSAPDGTGGDQLLKCTYSIGETKYSRTFAITVETPSSVKWAVIPERTFDISGGRMKGYKYQILNQWGDSMSLLCSYTNASGTNTTVAVIQLLASEIFDEDAPPAITVINMPVTNECIFGDQMKCTLLVEPWVSVQNLYVHQTTMTKPQIAQKANCVATNTVHWGLNAANRVYPVFWIEEQPDDPDHPLAIPPE